NNAILGNYLGTDVTGTAAVPNQRDGVAISSGAAGNTVGGTAPGAGNLISGNLFCGVEIYAAPNNLREGNPLGLTYDGMAARPNAYAGVLLDNGSAGNTIGGTAAGARNVISGNGWINLQIDGAGTASNVVLGNYVGLNAAGTAAVPNGNDG